MNSRGSASSSGAELLLKAAVGDVNAASALDTRGFLVAPGETSEAYVSRVKEIMERSREFGAELEEKGEIVISGFATLSGEMKIGDIMDEAAETTRRHYGFAVDWVPGFFISKGLGLLWGGCAVSFQDNPLPVFLIRAVFAERRKWLFYRRDELLAHELCHVARTPLGDRKYEETFAYLPSHSAFRRYAGGCFVRMYDAVLFLAGFLVLLAIQTANLYFGLEWIPMSLAWAAACAYPVFLFLRNHFTRRRLFKAERALRAASVAAPMAVLFRSTAAEIDEIAGLAGDADGLAKWLDEKAETEVRWKVISHRFRANRTC